MRNVAENRDQNKNAAFSATVMNVLVDLPSYGKKMKEIFVGWFCLEMFVYCYLLHSTHSP